MPPAGLHGPLHMAMAMVSVTASTLVLDLHSNTVALPAAVWADLSLSPTSDISLKHDISHKHQLNGLNYVLHLQKVPQKSLTLGTLQFGSVWIQMKFTTEFESMIAPLASAKTKFTIEEIVLFVIIVKSLWDTTYSVVHSDL